MGKAVGRLAGLPEEKIPADSCQNRRRRVANSDPGKASEKNCVGTASLTLAVLLRPTAPADLPELYTPSYNTTLALFVRGKVHNAEINRAHDTTSYGHVIHGKILRAARRLPNPIPPSFLM